MTSTTISQPQLGSSAVISNKVFAMMVFVFTEVMFFTALISAFLVIRGDQTDWAFPSHIPFPVQATIFNTFILLTSGVLLFVCERMTVAGRKDGLSLQMLGWSALLGFCFVVFQGVEWFQLLRYDFNMYSNIFGALFYVIIGAHALHAFVGAAILAYYWWINRSGIQSLSSLRALLYFWCFVVGVWPILYGLVYFP